MAIAKLDSIATPPIETTIPETIQEPINSVFTALVPESRITSLLKYVEGYPWTINYYGQIINKNNTLENFDPSTPNLTQPYYEVKNLILQVSSPLSSSYDQTTGITTITGAALTPYKLIPNVGDIFIANIDSGEDAIFLITSVSRKTYRKDTIYEISYSLYSYVSSNQDFVTSLKQRINDTYYFNKDTNFFNRDILIKPSVKEAKDRLNNYITETKNYYFSTFSQREAGSIIIPGVDSTIYDPLLLEFITKIIDYKDLVDIPFFRHNITNNRYINQPSIFNLLLTRNISLVNTINKKQIFIPSANIQNRARFGSIFHTGANYVLFPLNPNTNTDVTDINHNLDSSDYLSTIKTSKNYFLLEDEVIAINNENIFPKKILHELFLNDTYIVTDNFYNYINDNTLFTEVSFIELLIYKHINKEAIAKEDLVLAIEKYMNFSLLHQLYLLPVLWLLIKVNIS